MGNRLRRWSQSDGKRHHQLKRRIMAKEVLGSLGSPLNALIFDATSDGVSDCGPRYICRVGHIGPTQETGFRKTAWVWATEAAKLVSIDAKNQPAPGTL